MDLHQAPPIPPSQGLDASPPENKEISPRSNATDEIAPIDAPTKRAYKHHPKPDANAPERPYSAYVLFSNDVREQLKEQNLSFPELSREVGVRWQNIPVREKERWRNMAAGPWDEYKERVLAYQQTEQFREYRRYVEDFKNNQAYKQREDNSKRQRHSPGSIGTYPTPGQTPVPGLARAVSGSRSSLHSGSRSSNQNSSGPNTTILGHKDQMESKPKVSSGGFSEPARPRANMDPQQRYAEMTCTENTPRLSGTHRRLIAISNKLEECRKLLVRLGPQLKPEDQRLVQSTLDDSVSLET